MLLVALMATGFLPSLIQPPKVEAIKDVNANNYYRDPHKDVNDIRLCYNQKTTNCK